MQMMIIFTEQISLKDRDIIQKGIRNTLFAISARINQRRELSRILHR